jgi:hypothetical protein
MNDSANVGRIHYGGVWEKGSFLYACFIIHSCLLFGLRLIGTSVVAVECRTFKNHGGIKGQTSLIPINSKESKMVCRSKIAGGIKNYFFIFDNSVRKSLKTFLTHTLLDSVLKFLILDPINIYRDRLVTLEMRAEMQVGFHVKCPLPLPYFN